MAYVRPTPSEFKVLYPAFVPVADATVHAWLDKAPVDESWFEGDYDAAIMAWTAHQLVMGGIGGGDIAVAAAAGLSRLKSGTLDVSFSGGSSGGSGSGYGSTSYGRLWLELLARNKGGPRIAAGGGGCLSGWAKDWPYGGEYL